MRAVVFALALLPSALWGQEQILLQLRPHVGDTLRIRLEQQTEVTMFGNPGARGVTTSVAIHSRSIVRSVQQATTTVFTIVDSAMLTSTDARAASMNAETQRSLKGQQLVLQLGIDGAVENARDARGTLLPRAAVEAMSAMPAVFPRHSVSVGDSWSREMVLPSGGPAGSRGSAKAKAMFHLDSLQRAIAYVSMLGEIVPDANGENVDMTGSISGSMQLDRARGWMTDSHFLVIIRSAIKPPPGTGFAPMRFVTRVTQRLRTMDKR
ncbi:MAG: hypothetical protein JWM95_2683 [Gemmatimonadetes bacterium]|nr:hypothetical protein [Gemmatimonadota bacterium]